MIATMDSNESLSRLAGLDPELTSRDRNVLLVEDHRAVACALRSYVAGCPGLAVLGPVSTAHAGLELLAQADVVVLDLHLPDAYPSEVTELYRERAPSTPLILHSGEPVAEDISRGDPAVLKGNLEELVATIYAALAA